MTIASPGLGAELLPSGTVTNWSGFYVGAQVGGAWSETDWRYKNPNWFNTLGPIVVISIWTEAGL
ncbi:MAG: hypothetical protein H7X74_06570 [Methyloceanibacter sp.]|nr:hypothetical protein [Methyloceanibacter sp.]